MTEDPKKVAEAALFMSPDPMTVNELTKIMGLSSFSLSLKALEDLMENFNKRRSALEITTENGRYTMRVRPEFLSTVSHLAVSSDMSKAVLRTLGLIALKEPIKQSIVVQIVGNKAYGYISELTDRGFLKAKKAGSTKLLSTTNKFESYFGKQIDQIKKMSKTGYQTMLEPTE